MSVVDVVGQPIGGSQQRDRIGLWSTDITGRGICLLLRRGFGLWERVVNDGSGSHDGRRGSVIDSCESVSFGKVLKRDEE